MAPRPAALLLAVALAAALSLAAGPIAAEARKLRQGTSSEGSSGQTAAGSTCTFLDDMQDPMTIPSTLVASVSASCTACQEGCKSTDPCTFFTFNGSDPLYFEDSASCATTVANYSGPCHFYKEDYTTPTTDPAQDMQTTCAACQQACSYSDSCSGFSFNGSTVFDGLNPNACGSRGGPGPSLPSPSSPGGPSLCSWFSADGMTPVAAAASAALPTCNTCQTACTFFPGCAQFSFNGSMVTPPSNATACGVQIHTGPCRWFLDDGVTPSAGSEQDSLTSCDACRAVCSSSPFCKKFSFNGSAAAYATDTSSCTPGGSGHTGPCRWLLLDGVTPDSDPTQDTLSTCDDCRDGCASAPNCIFFTFEGLPTAPFDSSTACPSGPSSPTDYSQGHPCFWYNADGSDNTNEMQPEFASCVACQDGCSFTDGCAKFSYNGSSIQPFGNVSACKPQSPAGSSSPSPSPATPGPADHSSSGRILPCHWFLEDGMTRSLNPAQRQLRTCTTCQQQCDLAQDCTYWSFNNSMPALYSATGTCGINATAGLCQWFKSDGVTPDTTDAQGYVTDCNSCQQQCFDARDCIYWSYNGSAVRHYRAVCRTGQSGACSWFRGDGETPDTSDMMDNITDCASCQMQCADAPKCVFWSYNSTEKVHYSVMDGCDANRPRPCQWFLGDGTTPDTIDLQRNVSTCRQCRSHCAETDRCFFFSFNGTNVTAYDDPLACSAR